MDSVYGTKKYFPTLSNGNNAYRGQSCRSLANEFSYSNTMGRHSPIGPYLHMSKQATYSTDLSVNSQYGYNTWGTINDVRNIAPRFYTSKRPHKFRSFSIILTTAALIVLLAVLSIGALAFYFSGFKPSTDESMMIFEGSFRIQKGDLYSKALKNNQSSIHRQKVDFYRRFVERSLSDNDLQLTKVDIKGFGDGPLIDVQFVILLDMQNIPQNIHSIEDHIRNSLFLETNSLKSLYKFLKIEPESVKVVRVTGDNMSKIAPTLQHKEQTSKQSHFEKKLTQNSAKSVERMPSKYATTTHQPKLQKHDNEAEIDVEHAPVIQGSFEGSFEITKTDADITAKKTSPAKSSLPYTKLTTTSMSMRLKNKKNKLDEETTTPFTRTSIMSTIPATMTILASTTPAISSTTTQSTTIKPSLETTASNEFTTTLLPPSNKMQTTVKISTESEKSVDHNASYPPKLDLNLFTSAPVLDTKPWHPIHPSSSHYNNIQEYQPNERPTYNAADSLQIDRNEPGLTHRNKLTVAPFSTDPPNKTIMYQSFTNPIFMPGTTEIEKLGSSDVKPYPIPVPLIDDVVAPDVKSVLPMYKTSNEFTSFFNTTKTTVETDIEADDVNKWQLNRYNSPIMANTTKQNESAPYIQDDNITDSADSMQPILIDSHERVGEILLDLLQTTQNASTKFHDSEERVREISTTQRPNFLNIKDLVLNKTKFNSNSVNKSSILEETKLNNRSPGIINDTQLYPTQTKWEYKHDLTNLAQTRNSLKKKYNDTLQAVIIENHENLNISLAQAAMKRNSSEDIENITLIFDTLASKLGITSTFPTKEPPFAVSSQQKLKHDQKLVDKIRQTTSATIPISSPSPIKDPTTSIPQTPMLFSEQDPIIGEAEVEIVDPTKYEEMLSSQRASSTTSSPPMLVTLMPVRSNSGIRKLNPSEVSTDEGRKLSSDAFLYREAVVTSGIQVKA